MVWPGLVQDEWLCITLPFLLSWKPSKSSAFITPFSYDLNQTADEGEASVNKVISVTKWKWNKNIRIPFCNTKGLRDISTKKTQTRVLHMKESTTTYSSAKRIQPESDPTSGRSCQSAGNEELSLHRDCATGKTQTTRNSTTGQMDWILQWWSVRKRKGEGEL